MAESERLELIVNTEQSNGYFHIRLALVVRLADGRDTVRNANTWGRFWLDNLQINSQGDDLGRGGESTRHPLYGWEVRYAQPFAVDLGDARRMLKTLTLIDSGMRKLDARRGRPESFAEYACRVGEVLGAWGVTYARTRGSSSYDDMRFVHLPMGDARQYLAGLERQWIEAGR